MSTNGRDVTESAEGALSRQRQLFSERFSGRIVIQAMDGGVQWMSVEAVTKGSDLAQAGRKAS